MITPTAKAGDLHSRRYGGKGTPDLPEPFRRRLYLLMLDSFHWFKFKDDTRRLWGSAAIILGVSMNQESGMRYLVRAYDRLTGSVPEVAPLDLASLWLRDAMLTREPSFCLDLIDILLSQWWDSDESEAEVNEFFTDFNLQLRAVSRRVEQVEPKATRTRRSTNDESEVADMAWTARTTFVTGVEINPADLNAMSQQIERLENLVGQPPERKKPGRRSRASDLCAVAHTMRKHQDVEIADIARLLYPQVYSDNSYEAKRLASDPASKGRLRCDACVAKAESLDSVPVDVE